MRIKNNYKIVARNKALLFFVTLSAYLILLTPSCNEDNFLKTEPIGFYSPSNSFVTKADYDAAVTNIYDVIRAEFFSNDNVKDFPSAAMQGTDLFHLHKNLGFNTNVSTILLPENDLVYEALWLDAYRIIFDANAIIERANGDENELTDAEKSAFTAEAKFFRGYMYKMLANLYGGVPIVLTETKSPRRDYEKSSRQEVYQQAADDLLEAANGLGSIDEMPDHKVNNMAAYHVLSEVYISLSEWQKAIDAASSVISNSSTALMTDRFGTRKNEKALIPQYDTDVYWDLFRQGNQNRSAGNSEAIWVIQYEYLTPGGYEASFSGGPLLERTFAPRAWQAKIKNNDGSTSTLVPQPNAYTAGRSSGFIRPTHFFNEVLWQRSGYDQDLRNSDANIVRDFLVRNPASDHNGKWIFKDNLPISMSSLKDTTRNMFPWIMKTSTPGNQPAEAFIVNPSVEGALSWGHHAFRDVYAIRLAETYLLRAEAYLGAGDADLAAQDINVVRSRAQAPLITSTDVDIDYILDERARELYLEEFRLLTLTRLGKLVERTKELNPHDGQNYNEYHNLWPIPFSEIEKNFEGNLEQNPGY